MQEAEALDGVKCFPKASAEKGKEVELQGRGGQVLQAAYGKEHQQGEQMCEGKMNLEKHVIAGENSCGL